MDSPALTIGQLAPNPGNPRRISEDQIARLKKSLKEFGDLSGIIFNRKTGHLVGGHQRVKVLPADARIEMLTATHGIVTIDGDEFVYREVEWDETKEKAANIAANQHGGEWALKELTEWIHELDAENIDMDLLGFSKEELDRVLGLKVSETPLPDLPSGDKTTLAQMSFTVTEEQKGQIERALDLAKTMGDFIDTGNENSNGNALARTCELFVGQNGNR